MVKSREDLLARIAQLEKDAEIVAKKVTAVNLKLEAAKEALRNYIPGA